MSTKTSIKRIALVAAAALTLGGFSAVSAQAATTSVTPAAAASVTAVSATTGTYEIVTINAQTADKYYTVTTSGVGATYYPSATPDSTTNLSASSSTTELWYAGATPGAATFASGKTLSFSISSAVAGTQTITVVGDSNKGVQTLVYTWGAAYAFSASNSKVYLSSNTTASESAASVATNAASAITSASDATIVVVKSLALVGTIYVRALNNRLTGDSVTTGSFTATVSGSGLLTGRSTPSANMDTVTTRSATSYPDTGGYAAFKVFGDGTAGTGTISISYTDASSVTTALTTKTVIFTGSTPASLTATQSAFIATAGATLGAADTVTGDGAITATLADSNGYPVANTVTLGSTVSIGWYLVSSNTACITTTTTVSDGGVTSANGVNNVYGTYNLTVAGASGATSGCTSTVTPHYYVSATSDLAGAPITFTVGGTKIYSVALTADAASYAPGDKVTVSLTAKDSVGNAIADGTYGIFYDAAANSLTAGTTVSPLTLSAQTTNVPFSITAGTTAASKVYTFVKGVATSKFYAPYTNGTVSISGTLAATNSATAGYNSGLNSTLLGTALTGSFAVALGGGDSSLALDAANAATDAANNAYDEAQNATQAASDALAAVKALAVQVKALIALVTKIKNKVGA